MPAAGWEAVLLVALGWSATSRRLQHTASAATMLFLLTALPMSGDHGPWLTMPAPTRGWWTPVCSAAAAWFLYEAARSVPLWRLDATRGLCRTGMSRGMGCALVAPF
ncbi:hypothetical protein [Amycolatopsis sp. FDAARGOS 1241]|uniref:hypothetical protein n=1 Tax=Amycolatopsis sp. FDAARGOS 1241 TaxID=2778070 RepID=UPI0019518361|nr:hypothetical protein [Amycolatopsis sp. FDAARGOS 1241]QRP47078.1 hypothetical protein I6J71_03375 [Amycolatopsis sp. FDAARGOS 1241]